MLGRSGCAALVAVVLVAACGETSRTAPRSSTHDAGTMGDGRASPPGSSDAGLPPPGSGGADAGVVDASEPRSVFPDSPSRDRLGPVLASPPADTPRVARVDDCDFGGAVGNIVAVATTGDGALLEVTHDYVYFVRNAEINCKNVGSNLELCDHQTSLYRVPRCGGTEEDLGVLGTSASRLVAGGDELYALTDVSSGAAKLVRVAHDGTQTDVVSNPCIADVAADDDGFVVSDVCNGRIAAGTHDATVLRTIATAPQVHRVALGKSVVYFDTNEGIRWATRDGARTDLLTAGPAASAIDGLAVDGSSLFVEWHLDQRPDPNPYTIARIPVDGSVGETYGPYHEETGGIPSIDAVDGYLRFDALGVQPNDFIGRASTSGGSAIPIASRNYDAVRGYGQRTYFINRPYVLTTLEAPPRACPTAREPLHERVFSSDGNFEFDHAAFDSAGNLVASGSPSGRVDFGNGPVAFEYGQFALVKFDPSGTSLWAIALPATTSGGSDLAIDPQDRIVFSTNDSIATYSAAGALVSNFTLPSQSQSRVVSAGAGGVVYALEGTDTGAHLYAVGSDGKQLWSTTADFPDHGGPYGVNRIAQLDQMVVASVSFNAPGGSPGGTLLLGADAATGAMRFTRSIDGGVGAVTARPGEIVVVGNTNLAVDIGLGPTPVPQATDDYVFVARFGADGTPRSVHFVDQVTSAQPILQSDGSFYMAASGCVSGPLPDAGNPHESGTPPTTVVKVTAQDEVAWLGVATFVDTPAIAVGPDSVVAATGRLTQKNASFEALLRTFAR